MLQLKLLVGLNLALTVYLIIMVRSRSKSIMADLTNITQAVNDTESVEESAIVLIEGLAAKITAAGTDPAALSALVDSLNNEKTKLAAAVAANTAAAS